jgi:hypothetical protein
MSEFAFDGGHHDTMDHGTTHSHVGESNQESGLHSGLEGSITNLELGMVNLNHVLDLFHLSHPFSLGPLSHLWDLLHPAHSPSPADEHSSPSSTPETSQAVHHTMEMQGMIGDPVDQLPVWHEQMHPDSCAIVSQEFILHSITGHDIPEDTLMHEATAHGWYTPGGGTPMNDVGNLLELHGIHVEREDGASLADIAQRLEAGQEVIVGVNAEDIWYHGTPADPLTSYPGIPGQAADHAVEVIGIDNSDPAHPMVILNDPGTPDGRGLEVPADVFEAAWSASGNYMVSTVATQASHHSVGAMLGGYYNADGTYHYESDNTDRDPETGAIIRRW